MDRIEKLSQHIFLMQPDLVGAKVGALLVVSRQSRLGSLGTSKIALLRVRVQKENIVRRCRGGASVHAWTSVECSA
jgi:hypothetical protein